MEAALLLWEDMNNPRVFMVGWEYPPHNSGGLGVACHGLTTALAKLKTQIYFTLPFQFGGSLDHLQLISCYDPDWEEITKMPFSAYQDAAQSLLSMTTEDMSKPLASLPQSEIEHKVASYADLVANSGKRHGQSYDVIHAHDWMSFPAGIKVRQKTKKPLIAHVHSTEFDRIPHGYGSNYIHSTEKEGLEAADKIVAVSHFTKRLLIDRYGIKAEKIEVVHNGHDPKEQASVDLVSFAPERPVVVFMGRLTMQKGAEYFIDLASRVLEKTSDALFIVAGDGDQYRSLLFKTAGNRLSASVLFSGFLRGKEKEMLLHRADVFVMPSLSEPFGLVALEAAEQKIPVIISSSSGVSEVLKGAVVVDFWDTRKMAEEIDYIINNGVYRRQIVEKQSSSLPLINWRSAAEKMTSLYRRLLG